MDRETFELFLKEEGWLEDRFGHFHKTITRTLPHVDHPQGVKKANKYRVKMQAISARLEVQVQHAATDYRPAQNEWLRLAGAYYKDIVQLNDGRVRIGSSFLGKRRAP